MRERIIQAYLTLFLSDLCEVVQITDIGLELDINQSPYGFMINGDRLLWSAKIIGKQTAHLTEEDLISYLSAWEYLISSHYITDGVAAALDLSWKDADDTYVELLQEELPDAYAIWRSTLEKVHSELRG